MSEVNKLPVRYNQLLSKVEQDHLISQFNLWNENWAVTNTTISNGWEPEYEYDERVCDSFSAIYLYYSELENQDVPHPNQFLIRYSKKIAEKIADDIGVKIKTYVRMKANILFNDVRVKPGQFNCPHKDISAPGHISIIYYVHDIDGPTYVFPDCPQDRKLGRTLSFDPQKGTAIAFPADMYHASSNPHNDSRRYVLNIVFKYEEKNE